MRRECTAWQEYYDDQQSKMARDIKKEVIIDYGKTIYQTPVISDSSWVVTEFKNEYNVFLQSNKARKFVASFGWKESALRFAIRMLLICTGWIKRGGLSGDAR